MSLHIGIAGPISTYDIEKFIGKGIDISHLPIGRHSVPILVILIGELLKRGHKITVYTTSSDLSPSLLKPIIAQGKRFKVYYCPMRKRSMRMNGRYLGRIIDLFKLEREFLVEAIKSDDPQIVHAHWAYEFALAAIESGKPHIVTCHDAPQKVLKFMPNLYWLGRYLMAIKVMRLAKKLTTVSPYMSDCLLKYTKNEIEVIPNPISTEIVSRPFNKYRTFTIEKPVVVMVANGWNNLKNMKAGLLALFKLRSKLKSVRLKVFGAGFEPNGPAWKWAQQQGIDFGVEFQGSLPYEKLMEEIAEADLFLHPSLEESFGAVLAEAMALGIPVVAGESSGAVPWVVDKGGILTDVTNPDKIAAALFSILTDEYKWHELRELAYITSQKRFAPDVVVGAYEALYFQQLEGAQRCN